MKILSCGHNAEDGIIDNLLDSLNFSLLSFSKFVDFDANCFFWRVGDHFSRTYDAKCVRPGNPNRQNKKPKPEKTQPAKPDSQAGHQQNRETEVSWNSPIRYLDYGAKTKYRCQQTRPRRLESRSLVIRPFPTHFVTKTSFEGFS